MQVSVYLYTLQSEEINSASFVLPDECFVSGQVFKKKPKSFMAFFSEEKRHAAQFKILHSFFSCKYSYGLLH